MSNKIKRFFSYFLIPAYLTSFLCYQLSGQQRNLFFENITKEEGLSSNLVKDLVKDNLGFIWVATNNGLCRYDGPGNVKVFRADTLASNNKLVSDFIHTLFFDSRNNLWIGTKMGGLTRYHQPTDSWKTFLHKEGDHQTISHNDILSIHEDSQNRLWVGTENGLNLFDDETETFTNFLPNEKEDSFKGNAVLSILEDDKGWLWIGTWDGGLHLLLPDLDRNDSKNLRFRRFNLTAKTSTNHVLKIYQDKFGNYWIGTFIEGLFLMSLPKGASNQINNQKWTPQFFNYTKEDGKGLGIANNIIHDLLADSKGTLWIATVDGLSRIPDINFSFKERMEGEEMDKPVLKIETFFQNSNPNSNSTTTSDLLTAILEVEEGLVWLGTYGGISQYNQSFNQFKSLSLQEETGEWQNTPNICLDEAENIWIISKEKGLYKYSIKDKQIEAISEKYPNLLLSKRGSSIFTGDGKQLFIATELGVTRLNSKTLASKHYPIPEWVKKKLPNIFIYRVFVDDTGLIWLATQFGLFTIQPSSGVYTRYRHEQDNPNSLSDDAINEIFQDNEGTIWIGTWNGLNRVKSLDGPTIKFEQFISSEIKDKNGFISDQILAINQIGQQLYLGSTKGLFSYNLETKTFKSYNAPNNNSQIQAIQKINNAQLWISSFDGILSFNPESETFNLYGSENGLSVGQFRVGSAIKDNKGNLFFGSNLGLTCFHPSDLHKNEKIPPVYITEIKQLGPKGNKIQNGLFVDEIYLSGRDYYLSLNFTALNYNRPEKNEYLYQLEGFDNQWYPAKFGYPIVYTNLAPKTYKFKLKAANNDGVWNEEGTTLTIIKQPIFWETLWFKLITFFTLLFFTLMGISLYVSNIKAENKQEVQAQKNKLYTNIAHEFQIPLNIIQGLSKNLSNSERLDKTGYQYLQVILRNVDYLSKSINNLLTLSNDKISKPEDNAHLFVLPELIASILPELSFLAKQKNISLELPVFESPSNPIIYSDIDKLSTILKNLLSNAIKYTSPNGMVRLEYIGESEAFHSFEVKDNGRGIASDEIPFLFDRHFQSNQQEAEGGFGIGLTICKEYMKDLKGTIGVESKLGHGSVFSIKFPKMITPELTQHHSENSLYTFPKINSLPSSILSNPKKEIINGTLPQLLIVEDNLDFCLLLEIILKDKYQLSFVNDGADALTSLENLLPDLIITDWMMPKKNGIVLVEYLKQDQNYQHIPIIMLTARNLISDQLKAQKSGVDYILKKPVDEKLLHLKIANLLAQINSNEPKEVVNFSESYQIVDGQTIKLSKTNQDWLLKLEKVVQPNLQKFDLNLKDVAQLMEISVSSLNYKVKAFTGLTTKSFIQELRYWEARRLLEEKRIDSVKALSLTVGFKDVKNFSRNFKERFGKYPSDFFPES